MRVVCTTLDSDFNATEITDPTLDKIATNKMTRQAAGLATF